MKRNLGWMVGALLFGAVAGADEAPAALQFDPLPYAFDALEAFVDARTMEIHYTRHHRAYFDNLVKAVEGTPLQNRPLEELLAEVSAFPEAVRNNAGGHYNHRLFWSVLSPTGGGAPHGALAEALTAGFGSFEAFKAAFRQAALTRFGSGWAWLCVDAEGALFVTSTPNQDNPLMDVVDRRGTPILGLDVWEHAYYLRYQNQRGGYADAFWNVVDWSAVAARHAAARGGR